MVRKSGGRKGMKLAKKYVAITTREMILSLCIAGLLVVKFCRPVHGRVGSLVKWHVRLNSGWRWVVWPGKVVVPSLLSLSPLSFSPLSWVKVAQ